MKPELKHRRIDPRDGAGFQCQFVYQDDPPRFWSDCEQDAAHRLSLDELEQFYLWLKDHPKHTIMLRHPASYLCCVHYDTILETIGKGRIH